ncbi:uridine kinase [Synechococcus sp. A15-60]|uniref:uridine kinase family protein n=1 Tax=Synechococcus sp. A15-60 TaxID=1050655 RepID=UPI00186155C6|nr:nucleoside kinase [Synechococcus sp. A15-60]QNI48612.1 uridine kinase [Synechococcus sp. A15-60]
MSIKIPLICITGTSAAGKTHFSRCLANALDELGHQPVVIASDDYYRKDWVPDPLYGYDTIAAIDTEALISELRELSQGNLQRRRRYDMGTKAVSWTDVSPGWDLVILEGAFGPQVLLERMPPDLLVYVETSLTLRILRRLLRDTRERNRSIVSILNQTLNNMIPGERDFIQPLKQHADVIIHNPKRDLQTVIHRWTSQTKSRQSAIRDARKSE